MRRWLVPVLAAIGVAVAVVLIVTGGDEEESATVTFSDTTLEGVAETASLAFPDDTQDFLTARLDDGSQMDLTFTIDPDDRAAFVEGSGMADPVPGDRVIIHSSPLWELNPAQGTISGTVDASDELTRQVEMVEEGERIRVRISLRPNDP